MDALRYSRITGRNCILLKVPEGAGEKYVYEMFINNEIDGFIKKSEGMEDGEIYLSYHVDTLKPIDAIFREGMMGLEDVNNLVFYICKGRERLKKYMLPADGMVLSEKYIFVDIDTMEPSFIYIPTRRERGDDTFLDFLISVLNYDDEELVEAVYDVYSLKDDEGWPELLRQRLIGIRQKRREAIAYKEEIAVPENKPEEKQDYEELKEKDNYKDAVIYGVLYIGVALLIAYSLMDYYIFEGYETALLIVGGIFLSAVVCGIILKFKIPSLYAKLASRRDGYTGKPKKTEKVAPIQAKEVTQNGYTPKTYKEEEYSKTVYIEAAEPKQILLGQDKNRINIDLHKLPLTVGRQEKIADFVINNTSISKLHARFFENQDRVFVEDLNSTNGVIKNGIRLTPGEPVPLNLEDRVTMGDLDFVYA